MSRKLRTHFIYLFVLLFGGVLGGGIAYHFNPAVEEQPLPTGRFFIPYFSPNGGCTEAIVAAIGQAKETIYMQAYTFDSERIGDALMDAEQQGVKIVILVDQGQYKAGKASQIDRLTNQNTLRYIVYVSGGCSHSKTIVIDEKDSIFGSFNFDKKAETTNFENSLHICNDPSIAKKIVKNTRERCKTKNKYGVYHKKEGKN